MKTSTLSHAMCLLAQSRSADFHCNMLSMAQFDEEGDPKQTARTIIQILDNFRYKRVFQSSKTTMTEQYHVLQNNVE